MTSPRVPSTESAVLDDGALRRWLFRARDDLARHRGRIDALNVYPVPDGDTGTNLFLTLDGGVRGFLDALMTHAREGGGPLGVVGGAAALARSSLFAARGNSGVILSQLIAGLAEALAASEDVEAALDGPGLARALARADARARAAVADPVEGTILTVIREAAHAAQRLVAEGRVRLGDVVDAARDAARVALQATPTQLEALARSGVVDAGGAGLVVVLEALAAVVHGEPEGATQAPAWLPAAPSAAASARVVSPSPPDAAPLYEVMYLLDRVAEDAADRLGAGLRALGDSVLVAGDAALRTVHVHCSDAGAAVEAGLDVGRPYGIRISLLPAEAVDHECAAPDLVTAATSGANDTEPPVVGLVACVQAPRLAPLFEDAGAVVVADGPGMRVTPADLVSAARATRAATVALLPDDGDALLAADAARGVAAEEGIDLEVLPSRHLLQGVAALAVYEADDEDSVDRMRRAVDAVRCGLVATATRAVVTDVGECRPGDVVGFVGDRVVHVGDDARAAAWAVIDELVTDPAELVTLLEGEQAAGLGERVRDSAPDADLEFEVLDGGQAVYDLLIGVE